MMTVSMALHRAVPMTGIAALLCSSALISACASTATSTVAPTGAGSTVPGSPTPIPAGSSTTSPSGTAAAIALRQVAMGFQRPLDVVDAGDVPTRVYVVEQGGRIMVVEGGTVRPTPFLDITSRLTSAGNEQGLLSVAFAPDYVQSGRFFVDYTNLDGDTVIERFARAASGTTADLATGTVLLTIQQPAGNHNGGRVLFGPDDLLYVGMGDGGGSSETGQLGDTLLGKMLRVDVRGDGYTVPPDNPFVADPGARAEVWALGLRNPWRFSFDRTTRDLWIGDVGAGRWEEIDVEPASSQGGENYGWPRMEGTDCGAAPCDPSGYVLPVAGYRHGSGDCAVIGGYVYRGVQFPELEGTYLYGDECSGRIWALSAAEARSATATPRVVLESGLTISSFGEDRTGELYLTDLSGGGVYHVVGAP